MKKYVFTKQDRKTNEVKNVGYMQLSTEAPRAKLYFYGDICSERWLSKHFDEDKCPQDVVDFLSELNGTEAVDIYINSGGGSVFGGLAIYNILKRYEGEKVVHIDGLAASIASVIAMCGDKVIVPSCSQVMIHKPLSYITGNADEMRKQADILDGCEKSIIEVYLSKAKPGITEGKLAEMMENETWFTGTEVSEYFNVEIEECAEVAACAGSTYFDSYKSKPNVENKQDVEDIDDTSDNLERLQFELDLLSL